MEDGGIEEIKRHSFFSMIDWINLWEILPPKLEPGLVLAPTLNRNPAADNIDHHPIAGPVYHHPEFFQGVVPPYIPPQPQPQPHPHLMIYSDPHPPHAMGHPDPHFDSAAHHHPISPSTTTTTGLGLAFIDTQADQIDNTDHNHASGIGSSSKPGLGNTLLSKRKSWLLGAGRRRSKEDKNLWRLPCNVFPNGFLSIGLPIPPTAHSPGTIPTDGQRLDATIKSINLLSKGRNPTVEKVIDYGVVNQFDEYLRSPHSMIQ
ncbi:hypothetical protein MJO28_012147 [Puccinia striiformis f. sp. tritici]|uniref:Uncharacterized protein n=1 Tax=Puccinia striiformis f. sp. tritici TaxID=168172 RepID=A0ACC0DZG9_9BASI|nr:hypothetical protein MJO28_012147 [Puccinia striiformis f. sp. tritici]